MPGIRVLGAYMPEELVGRHLIKQIGARLGREAKHVLQSPQCLHHATWDCGVW